MEHKIPYYSFDKINADIQDDLEMVFKNVLNSKWYILGSRLEKFEHHFAEYLKDRKTDKYAA